VVAQGKVFVIYFFRRKFKQFFGDVIKHSVDYNSIPAAALTHYLIRRFSVTLHNALANTWVVVTLVLSVTRVERDAGVDVHTIEQLFLGPASVSNRRGVYS
jgi:hypothetical protein